jgi:hypothetical protein
MSPDTLAISCLRYSAHTFGDRILSWVSWEKGKENGPFGSFAPPLKNPQKMHWTHLSSHAWRPSNHCNGENEFVGAMIMNATNYPSA